MTGLDDLYKSSWWCCSYLSDVPVFQPPSVSKPISIVVDGTVPAPHKRQVLGLMPRTYDWDLIWEQALCICN